MIEYMYTEGVAPCSDGPLKVRLDGVVRIARSASIGVSGNTPRIAKAEAAMAAVRRLVDSVDSALSFGWNDTTVRELQEAIKPFRQEAGNEHNKTRRNAAPRTRIPPR